MTEIVTTGDARRVAPLLKLHDAAQHVEVELCDEAVALEARDELGWCQEAELAAAPAHKGLSTDTFPRHKVVLWLVPNLKFFAGKRPLLQAVDAALEFGFLLQLGIVEADGMRLVQGEVGVVHRVGDGKAWPQRADADVEGDVHDEVADADVFIQVHQLRESLLDLLLARKGIRAHEEQNLARAGVYGGQQSVFP